MPITSGTAGSLEAMTAARAGTPAASETIIRPMETRPMPQYTAAEAEATEP